MDHQIRFSNVTKTYGTGSAKICALDDVSFTVDEGQFCVLLGSSGAGKTTLLNMLGGMDHVTAGKIIFDGKDVSAMNARELAKYRRKDVGFVFQFYNLIPNLTALENVEIAAMLCDDPIPADEALDMVGLTDRAENFPAQLSGGEQQRVAIARALVKKPEVLLLDEPLSNLDAKLRVETREEIRRIQQEVHITTIFVTHDQEEAMSISDKIAVIDRGVLQQYEIPQKMYLNPCNLFVASFLGTPEINIFDAEVKNGTIIAAGNVLRENCNVPDGSYKAGVRPESFNVSLQPDVLPGAFRTEASRVRMTGRELQIRFPMGSNECRLLVHSDMQIRKGTTLYLTARDNSILLFDGQGAAIGKF